jgi:hypothetical protein
MRLKKAGGILMKNLIVIAIIFMMVLSMYAQEEKPFMEKGAKALLFEFSGLDDIGANSYRGGFGAKYFWSNDLAIRGSLQFANIRENIPFQGTDGVDGYEKASQFGLLAAVEKHLTTNRLSPYFGGGLGFSFTSTEEKTAAADTDVQITYKNGSVFDGDFRGETEFQVFGMIGAEIFILRMLSLSAEYQLVYARSSAKDYEVTQGTTTQTFKQGNIRGFGIISVGVLTVAVYF